VQVHRLLAVLLLLHLLPVAQPLLLPRPLLLLAVPLRLLPAALPPLPLPLPLLLKSNFLSYNMIYDL
jgi:hypothetical protein